MFMKAVFRGGWTIFGSRKCLDKVRRQVTWKMTALHPSRSITVAIEGNIGSGKTTFLDHFSKTKGIEVIQEPVDMWRNVRGHNTLALMYSDPKRWSFAFQSYVQLTMLDIHTRKQKSLIRMMERSIYSAKYCFVENMHESGNMTDAEYVVLTEWFDWILANQKVQIDLIVYLKTSPEVCHQRIKQRCREEEKAIPLDYLQALHSAHEDWLTHKKFPTPTPVLVLNGDHKLSDMYGVFEENRHKILLGQNL
ncbi:thymidine kinase 2, mitochondrial-like [Branchiostoma floridae x Branchiostoma belcheri]